GLSVLSYSGTCSVFYFFPTRRSSDLLEIRAGTGGDEASLFAADILRMYARYAERQRWKMEILDASETGIGGLKEAVALIEGDKRSEEHTSELQSPAQLVCRLLLEKEDGAKSKMVTRDQLDARLAGVSTRVSELSADLTTEIISLDQKIDNRIAELRSEFPESIRTE